MENVAPSNPLAAGAGYFEVKGTPPDERRRRERRESMAAAQEPGVLLLTPFTASPRIEFDRIKLGSSGVRRLLVRNPGDKPLDVALEKLPKEEKGFNVDYVSFRLGGREETSLLIGWTPSKGGGLRDSFIVKFGKFSAQVILIGTCLAPEDKKQFRAAPAPRPLGNKNTNKTVSGRRPTVAASKLSAAPKIAIPVNPVERKSDSPVKRIIAGLSPPREEATARKREDFVCGTEVRSLEIPQHEANTDLRRETFVHERPQPRGGDVMSSTPIAARTDPFRALETVAVPARETRLDFETVGEMLPPAQTDIRRQTYIPEHRSSYRSRGGGTFLKPSVPVAESWTPQKLYVEDVSTNLKRLQPGDSRKTWSQPAALEPASRSVSESTTPAKSTTPIKSNTPAKLPESKAKMVVPELVVEEELEDSDQDLSLSPRKTVSVPKVLESGLTDVLAQLINTSISEPLNLSLKGQGAPCQEVPLVMVQEVEEAPMSPATPVLAPATPRRYQPRVSDISAATCSPSTERCLPAAIKDPRLLQLMAGSPNNSGALDLSSGSQLGDCSMAAQCSSPARAMEDDMDEELAEVADSSWEELDVIAAARATSAAGVREEEGGNTSSGTVVLGSYCAATLEVEEAEWKVVREEEVLTTQVTEEVMEYEYEIVGGVRRLVAERLVGSTSSSQSLTVSRTPVKSFSYQRHAVHLEQEATEFLQIGGADQDPQLRPRSVDLTADLAAALLPSPMRPGPAATGLELPMFDISLGPQEALPGLRGSPRVGHQLQSGRSFLQSSSPAEMSFLPPSPGDRRCSTGVKMKDGILLPSSSPGAEVRKSLQFGEQGAAGPCQRSGELGKDEEDTRQGVEEVVAGTRQDTTGPRRDTTGPVEEENSAFQPLNSHGFQLPVISSPTSSDREGCRLSSDTFITSPRAPLLSVIMEERCSQVEASPDSARRSLGLVARPDSASRQGTSSPDSARAEDAIPGGARCQETSPDSARRAPARPRRSNISYTRQAIEDIALEPEAREPEMSAVEPVESSSHGLMFFSISPTAEKRKPEEQEDRKQQNGKRIRPQPRPPVVRPPTVRAVKNPAPPRPTAPALSRTVTAKSTGARPKTAAGKIQSLPARGAVTRAPLQPARRLQLATKSKLVHHPNPFAARNMYYDDKWVEKQERGFTRWLNFMLTPQNQEDASTMLPGAVDVAKLWSQCSKDVRVPRAPTREVMSMRAYTAKREMNRLRRAACKLWQSPDVASVVSRLELEIDKLRLVIRKDRNINRDVGMKQKLLQLILSYNPLWLRVGLETVYGELLQVGNNSDVLGLTRFLLARLLGNPDIMAEWAHPFVPHSYRDGYLEALNRFSLKKFLELVYFLDVAKEARMIQMNPCLFCPDAELKTSKDVLLEFSKDYLQGEGDVTKHLGYMGYIVTHRQTKLDEFDYAVTNIRTDLRCGLRLTKVAELLTSSVLGQQMRLPAISRTQKVHNNEVAVTALRQGGFELPAVITAKDLVDGHREKTLQLLWSIIFGHSLTSVLDLAKLREEILHLRRSLKAKVRMGDKVAEAGQAWLQEVAARSPPAARGLGEELGPGVALLLEWAQLVLAQHGVRVDNWTVSWADGRGLCYLLHHYQPALLEAGDIKLETTLTVQADNENLDDSLDFNYGTQQVDPSSYEAFLENEKSNFKLLLSKVSELGGVPVLIKPGDMSNTIPDEKVTATFIGYLAARLLDLSREIKAARTIQLAWRRTAAVRREKRIKVKYAESAK